MTAEEKIEIANRVLVRIFLMPKKEDRIKAALNLAEYLGIDRDEMLELWAKWNDRTPLSR